MTTVVLIGALIFLLFILNEQMEGTLSMMIKHLWLDAIVALILIGLAWYILGLW